jgi:putative exporter of polyketide antibiotics
MKKSKILLLILKFAIVLSVFNIFNVIRLGESTNCILGWINVIVWQMIVFNFTTKRWKID